MGSKSRAQGGRGAGRLFGKQEEKCLIEVVGNRMALWGKKILDKRMEDGQGENIEDLVCGERDAVGARGGVREGAEYLINMGEGNGP